MNTFDYFEKWQSGYCAGVKMPDFFRIAFTNFFDSSYDRLIKLENLDFSATSLIFRVINFDADRLIFNNLYYSFSKDIKSVNQVIKFDRNLRDTKCLLLICKPVQAIDFNKLGDYLYEDYANRNRYAKENEVVSKFNYDSLYEAYIIPNSNEIEKYKELGIRLNLEDLKKFSFKQLLKNII